MMRAAILHFHLRAGGVTRVVELACEALCREGWDVLVVSGEEAPPGCRVEAGRVAVVPELGYDRGAGETEALREGVEGAMRRRWGGAVAEVVHTHNHALGKNFALPGVVAEWAREGRALVLQLHDFAENGRPGNYARLLGELGGREGVRRVLYPMGGRVGYAVLNRADLGRLERAGLTAGGYLLANPVSLPEGGEAVRAEEFGAERLVVYPTRGIRRKNVGEAVLWGMWAEGGERVVLTGAPEKGEDVRRYAEWKAFAETEGLPVTFDGQGESGRRLVDLLAGAEVCLTTSVAEGFGMAFLEPWLGGKAVTGRDLPGVTGDFREAGVRLDGLYGRLDVGVRREGEIRAKVEKRVRAMCEAYEVECREEYVASAARAVLGGGGEADFGRLDEEEQREVIRALRRSGERRGLPVNTTDVAANRARVEEVYSQEAYGKRLGEIYREVLAAEGGAGEWLDTRGLLMECLDFEDFFALRS